MPRIYVASRSKKRTRVKGWIQSNVRFGTVSDPKVSNKYGSYSVLKFKYNLWLQIKPNHGLELWTVLTNLPEKPCRSKRKRKLLGKPAAKARPILKPSSTSGWGFTPMEQRQWIDIGTQESNDPFCFQVSKFITRFLRHSQYVNRQDDGAIHCDQNIDECKKKLSDDTGYWSVEVMQQFTNAPYWSIDKWISVLAKGGGQKKGFQYCLNPNYPQKILYLRAIGRHSRSTINPALQDNNVQLAESFTEKIYHVGNGKELRSTVNHGLTPGAVSLKQADKLCFSLLCIRWLIKMA